MKRFIVFSILWVLFSSCVHVISREHREDVVSEVSFSHVMENPDAYLNKKFILGGIVVEATNSSEGTEIEMVQVPVDRLGNIMDRDTSEGRFILTSPDQLDPVIYKKSRTVTLVGRLVGSRTQLLGTLEYRYPVFEAIEIYLWKENRYYRYPTIYPYPYWYSPYAYPYYWYDPFWPRRHFYPYP